MMKVELVAGAEAGAIVSSTHDCCSVNDVSLAVQSELTDQPFVGERARAHCMIKRSIRFGNRWTSFSLEPQFWTALDELADAYCVSLSSLIKLIDAKRDASVSITSALRVFAFSNHTQRKDFDSAKSYRALLTANS